MMMKEESMDKNGKITVTPSKKLPPLTQLLLGQCNIMEICTREITFENGHNSDGKKDPFWGALEDEGMQDFDKKMLPEEMPIFSDIGLRLELDCLPINHHVPVDKKRLKKLQPRN